MSKANAGMIWGNIKVRYSWWKQQREQHFSQTYENGLLNPPQNLLYCPNPQRDWTLTLWCILITIIYKQLCLHGNQSVSYVSISVCLLPNACIIVPIYPSCRRQARFHGWSGKNKSFQHQISNIITSLLSMGNYKLLGPIIAVLSEDHWLQVFRGAREHFRSMESFKFCYENTFEHNMTPYPNIFGLNIDIINNWHK